MWKGVALGAVGTLALVLALLGWQMAAQPTLSQTDLAYCAVHATVIADMWAREGAPGTVDPAADVALIAGYYQDDQVATVKLAARSYADNFGGEIARTDRIDGPLGSACRALTHP